jgi:flagellin-specific chaperone FliS
MELGQAIKKLNESKEFKEWTKKNKDTFLSYAFKMLEDNKNVPWQLGFYHKATDKIITFIVDRGSIQMQKEEEVFKKPDMEVRKLEIEKVKLPFEEILKKSKKFQNNKYPKELISRTIAILQNIEEYDTVWNITYVMHSFKTLNMKVNPENGKILYHSLESLMDFIKK